MELSKPWFVFVAKDCFHRMRAAHAMLVGRPNAVRFYICQYESSEGASQKAQIW